MDFYIIHGLILSQILLEREHAFTIECKETDANFPDQNVQRHSVTSLGTARSLSNGPSWEGGGG